MEHQIEKYMNNPLFDNITADHLQAMLGCLHSYTRNYKKCEVIIMEEDSIQYVGIVLTGTVHMMKEDIWGRQTLLTYISENEVFGETFAVQKKNDSYVTFIAGSDAPAGAHRTGQLHRCQPQCPDPRARRHARGWTHRLR